MFGAFRFVTEKFYSYSTGANEDSAIEIQKDINDIEEEMFKWIIWTFILNFFIGFINVFY